jgi:hypothetical protein
MKCPDCVGGWQASLIGLTPCNTCGGSGIAYCCEGERSDPRAHVSSPYCWCDPQEVEPGLWLHNDTTRTIH